MHAYTFDPVHKTAPPWHVVEAAKHADIYVSFRFVSFCAMTIPLFFYYYLRFAIKKEDRFCVDMRTIEDTKCHLTAG